MTLNANPYVVIFDADALNGRFWNALERSDAVNFDFMIHDDPLDPRPYRYELTDVANDQLLPPEVASVLIDQDMFVATTFFEADEPVMAYGIALYGQPDRWFCEPGDEDEDEALVTTRDVSLAARFDSLDAATARATELAILFPTQSFQPQPLERAVTHSLPVLQTSGGFNNLLWAGSPEVVRELLASMTDHDRGVGVYRSNQHDQYVSVQFNTRSAAFAEDDIAPLGVRHREILTVLKGLADNLPAIVSDLRAGSTPTESVAHVICDSNGEGIGELWLRQARDDVAALKKGAVGLLFPMSCVKDADCSQGSALLRDAANQLRARGLCDEFEIAGDLQMMIRAPKGEKLNDHIARRLAGVVPDSFDMDELVTLISHAREINVNPDSNAPGIPVCVVSSNDGAAVETESDVMPGH